VIDGLRSFGWLFILTFWHGLRVSVAALIGVPDRLGGFYDQELRRWARRLLEVTGLPVETKGRELKKGAFVLAIEARAPLVPVYLGGTHEAMPPGGLWLRRRPVILVVGEPIPTDGLAYEDRDALLVRAREWFLAEERAVDGARRAE
jgi:hypothetical protein